MLTARSRSRAIQRTLWIVLLLNLAVAGAKLLVGWQIGALSLLADGLHSVLDASSNVVGLVGISVAAKPPDESHPYGHQRFETLAAVSIGLLIGAGFVEILGQVIAGISGQSAAPVVTWSAAAVVLLTILVNVFISRYESAQGRKLQSSVLAADSQHTLSDALGAGAVLLGFGLVSLGFAWGDWVAASVVATFIARTAWAILRENLGILADAVRLDPARVREIALTVPGVRGAHRVRSRGSADYVLVDLHIHLDPQLPLLDAHQKTHEVMNALKAALPQIGDVVIHTEPADGRENAPT